MTAIRQYATETGFTGSVDRWSFAMEQQQWDNVSSGISGDFGLNIFFMTDGDLRVRAVEKASPAGLAGVKRGWRITKINGNSNITLANADFIVQNVYYTNSTNFTFTKPDGTSTDIRLTSADYQENPIILDSVYTVSGKKIGYLSFGSFLGDTTQIYNEFNRIFNRFGTENVADVVIDLRYNGGGYVTVAERLANFLAPSSANGGVMMTQKFNDKYTTYNSTRTFSKRGSLNLTRVFFIVGKGTASASELLINSMKPYMQTFVLGADKTHGKPVGYFPIPVGNWYIFPVSFITVNKNGQGGYYNGIELNHQVADGLDKDWGDINETSLASAIKYVTTGAFRLQSSGDNTVFQQSIQLKAANATLDVPNFKGTIDPRKFKK
jgi:C-terminal processing protease CtpA/Prc